MIDPDGILTQSVSLSNVITINSEEICPCDIECYCLDDEKEYEKFIKDVESQVRRSMEYRSMINYLRENMQMNQCAFLKGVSNEDDYNVKIEIHHYPFTLRDITEVVIRKRQYYKESITVQMVAKEVMELHYKMMVGLIPLSQTVHELAHSSRLFIPSDKVLGRYNMFINYYEPFCDPEILDILDRIEKYSSELVNSVLNTNIIEQNKVSYEVKDPTYMIPDTSKVNTAMLEQLSKIKENNYILPSVRDMNMIEEKKEVKPAFEFDYSLIKKPEGL